MFDADRLIAVGGLVLVAALVPLQRARAQDQPARPTTPAERLAAVEVDPETAREIKRQIRDLAYVRRQGSAHLIRQNRLTRLLDEHGIRAVPFLCRALTTERYWSARLAGAGLGRLARGPRSDEVRWLAYHFDAPSGLIGLFGRGPRSELIGLHLELNATLAALIPEGPVIALSHRTSVDEAKREGRVAAAAWRAAWKQRQARWLAVDSMEGEE